MRFAVRTLYASVFAFSLTGAAMVYAASAPVGTNPASRSPKPTRDAPTLAHADALMKRAVANARGKQLNPDDVLLAYDALQAWRRSSVDAGTAGQAAADFGTKILPIYRAAADALFEKYKDNEQMRVAALLSLGEAVRINQIEILADGCSPASTPFATSDLKDGETIIYPIVGRSGLYLLSGTKPKRSKDASGPTSGWKLRLVEGDPDTLTRAASKFFEKFRYEAQEILPSKGVPIADWGASEAKTLYDAILRPVLADLPAQPHSGSASAPVLIMVPDPLLRNVPWATLRSREVPREDSGYASSFVVAHYAVATVPALGFVREAGSHRGGLLVAGSDAEPGNVENCDTDPTPSTELLQSFVCELGTGRLKQRGRLGPVGAGFTQDNLDRQLRRGGFSSLLIAAHAKFEAGESYVVLPGKRRLDITALAGAVSEKKVRDTRFDLLIFVSCESSQADVGSLGLAGAAVRSGASTTLGALIEVPVGYPQSLLIAGSHAEVGGGSNWAERPRFLETYFSGVGAAESLRRVQFLFLTQQRDQVGPRGMAQLDEPVAWGNYQLVGWWR